MKKKLLAMMLAMALAGSMVTGCGSSTGNTATSDKSDEEIAEEVAKLIDDIYVQEWTDDTPAKCKAAKDAWDALTDEQKEMVEGENADPDYFGRDTGDADKDDTLNSDDIDDNEILVVSFGTSFNDSRAMDIGSIEKAVANAYPDWQTRRAFTSQIIMNHILARDGKSIDNVEQALKRAKDNGVKNLIIQPTHLMHGAEYDELVEAVEKSAGDFEKVQIAEPLLGQVGKDATKINADKEAVAKAVVASAASTIDDETALVLMGHGTSHTAKVTYSQMQTQMDKLGYKNVFIGTVEGEPEDTACDKVIEKVKAAGYKKVALRPLMVVAGDHANNDMAGDEDDSWKSQFEASGAFDKVDCIIEGLGRIEAVDDIYVSHVKDAIKSAGIKASAKSAQSMPEDGEYIAEFNTDSSMFHVNEAKDGKGELTVKDGEATIHISLVSKKIVKLFLGKAKDAEASFGPGLIEPTEDEITFDDGTTEVVYGFDVPVMAIGEDFNLAILGTKGKWYDHVVSVSNPTKK